MHVSTNWIAYNCAEKSELDGSLTKNLYSLCGKIVLQASSPLGMNLKHKNMTTLKDVIRVTRLVTLSSLETNVMKNDTTKEPLRKLWDRPFWKTSMRL
ncbi:hypothetical protein TNCV_1181 [Trichonephila clavipes]|nr:hypothetical protein TNCV_1181 [Trichonephila clavipes]